MKRVLILHTGGAFGMSVGLNAQILKQPEDVLRLLLNQVPELQSLAQIDLQILCNIDSSNADPVLWANLAEVIYTQWSQYDGFVIVHGTDTMAYAASALSFFLENPSKPIVFTGSQRPLKELRNDARINIIDAVEFAGMGFGGVFICFDHVVHLGVRATKSSNNHMQAFRSPKASVVGDFGVQFNFSASTVTKKQGLPKKDLRADSKILILPCIPGMTLDANLIQAILKSTHALILSGFGAGNLPTNQSLWIDLCREAQKMQIPVAMISQCETGKVDLTAYENGRTFLDLGVMSCQDMTMEASALKMMVLLGRQIPYELRFDFFENPLVGECTRREI